MHGDGVVTAAKPCGARFRAVELHLKLVCVARAPPVGSRATKQDAIHRKGELARHERAVIVIDEEGDRQQVADGQCEGRAKPFLERSSVEDECVAEIALLRRSTALVEERYRDRSVHRFDDDPDVTNVETTAGGSYRDDVRGALASVPSRTHRWSGERYTGLLGVAAATGGGRARTDLDVVEQEGELGRAAADGVIDEERDRDQVAVGQRFDDVGGSAR